MIKKILLSSLILSTGIAFSQKITTSAKKEVDSVYIVKSVDDMTDKTYYFPTFKIPLINKAENQGLGISAFIDEKEYDNTIYIKDLDVKSINVGGCVEKSEIIFLFEDGSKINLISWNKFNCDGNSWFEIPESDSEILSTKELKKVKFINGRSYDSFTLEVPANRKRYFIQLYDAVKNNRVVTLNKK
jgi:hypothetical protein